MRRHMYRTVMFVLTKMNMVSMPWVTCGQKKGFVLFDLILYVQSTIFPLNRDGSSLVEPVLN